MTPALLVALGMASQLLGVIVAFVGVWKTWHAFAAGERFPTHMWRGRGRWAGPSQRGFV